MGDKIIIKSHVHIYAYPPPSSYHNVTLDIDFADIEKQIDAHQIEKWESYPVEIHLIIPKGNYIFGYPVRFRNGK